MTPPHGYKKLPPGVRCRCVHLWADPDNPDYWCCNDGRREPLALRLARYAHPRLLIANPELRGWLGRTLLPCANAGVTISTVSHTYP